MSRTYSRYSTPSGASTGSYGDTPSHQGYDRGYSGYSYDRGYSYGSYGSSTAYGSGYGSTDYSSDRNHSYGSYGSATDLADRPTHEYATDTDYAGGDADAAYDDYDDEIYEYEDGIDRRWVWVAGVAGAILLVAVICTVVILGGGDSGPVTAPITPPSTSQSATPTASAAPSATPRPRVTAAPPPASLAPETVTTVTPTAAAPTPTEAVPPVDPAAVPAAPLPNTVTYRITGNKSLLDLVTVIYTDGQGALQTDVNVALPWAKTVTLNPGVTLSSVTATSVTGQLNCSISDGSGQAVAVQNNNTMITTCTK
jgi:hypothetical protein